MTHYNTIIVSRHLASWSEPVLTCSRSDMIVELVGAYYTPGMHGGAYTLELLVANRAGLLQKESA